MSENKSVSSIVVVENNQNQSVIGNNSDQNNLSTVSNNLDSILNTIKESEQTVFVILSEQHTLKDEQLELLKKHFSERWVILSVSKNGWTNEDMYKVFDAIRERIKYKSVTVVFASPLPYLLKLTSYFAGSQRYDVDEYMLDVYLFHNDKRDKKEVNGKLTFTVSQTGWKLI